MRQALYKVIDALNANPIAFALVVINVVYLGVGLLVYQDQMARYANLTRHFVENCWPRS